MTFISKKSNVCHNFKLNLDGDKIFIQVDSNSLYYQE